MPLRVATGFDHGSTAGWTTGSAGNKYADATSGTPPTIVTTAPRTGTYHLRVNTTALNQYVRWTTDTLTTSQNRVAIGFAIRFPGTVPTAAILAQDILAAGLNIILFTNASDQLCAGFEGGATTTGPTVVADTWYYVELYHDMSTNPHTLDWRVDSVAQTQVQRAQAATTLSNVSLGTTNSETYEAYYDDLVIYTDTAAITFPIGEHKVVLLTPDTGGSLDVSTINTAEWNTFAGSTPTLSAWNAATALGAIDEVPVGLGASADGFARITGTDTDYVGIPFTSYTLAGGETIVGLRMLACCWAASGTACFHSFAAYNGTTAETVLASSDVGTDNSATAPAWVCKMLPTLANYDTQGELDALQVRFGSTDTTPDAGIHAVYVEVAVKEVVAPSAEPDDAAQAHSATEPTITGHTPFAPANAAQAHAATEPSITGHTPLAPANAAQAHSATEPSITGHDPGAVAAAANALQAHTATEPSVTGHTPLAPASAAQSHSATSPVVTAHTPLAPASAAQAHSATEPSITFTGPSSVTPANAAQSHLATEPTITAHTAIAVHSAAHAHSASEPTVVVGSGAEELYLFTPPLADVQHIPTALMGFDRMMSRLPAAQRGVNVWKDEDGWHSGTLTIHEEEAALYVFLGARTYTVSAALADELIAAGFEVEEIL